MSNWNAVGLFCDDVRQEIGGTTTIVGLQPDNMLVPQFPCTLLKLTFVVRIHIPIEIEPRELSARIILTDGKELLLGTFSAQDIDKAREQNRSKNIPTVGFILTAVAGGLNIPVAGLIKLFAKFGDEERLCGVLNVQASSPLNDSSQQTSRPSAASQMSIS